MQFRPYRYQTRYPITVKTPIGPQSGKIVDVHNAGARINGLRDLRRGDKVSLSIRDQQVTAVVQWAGNGFVGIAFRQMISDDQVDTLRYCRDAPAHHRQMHYDGFFAALH